MGVKMKAAQKKPRAKKIPPPGRKMSKQEARDYAFKTYRETLALLAKH